MTPQREDNYQVAEVSNVTAAPNVSQQNAVNKIVINVLDELLTIDDTRTTAPTQILLVVSIFLFCYSYYSTLVIKPSCNVCVCLSTITIIFIVFI